MSDSPEPLCRLLATQIILACGVDPPSQRPVVGADSAVAQRLNRQPAGGPGWSDWGWLGRLADSSLTLVPDGFMPSSQCPRYSAGLVERLGRLVCEACSIVVPDVTGIRQAPEAH